MAKGRRAVLTCIYNGTDISAEISQFLRSFVYSDNSADQADDLQLELDDREGYWLGPWFPAIRNETDAQVAKPATPSSYTNVAGFEDITGVSSAGTSGTETVKQVSQGSQIVASITVHDWAEDGRVRSLPCGTFEVDSIQSKVGDSSGDVFVIKAISVAPSSRLRNQQNTRAWESTRLSRIGAEIAGRSGLGWRYDVAADPDYDRLEQIETADLAFLQQLCNQAGLSLKATGEEVVVFDQAEYEARPAIKTIKRGTSEVISWDFALKTDDTYASCTVNYTDPLSGQTITQTFEPDSAGTDSRPEYIINIRPPSVPRLKNIRGATGGAGGDGGGSTADFSDIMGASSASTLKNQAMAALREKNKDENTVTFTLHGDPDMCAGSTVNVEGWGYFDGKYIIDSATHTVNGSGYITKIQMRRCLDGY